MASLLKKAFIGLFAFIFILVVGAGTFLYYASYSDGFRVGTILKLSRKGMLFKTWEGELSQGFLESSPDQGVATKIWPFTVNAKDQATLDALQEAVSRGSRVKLYYDEKYVKLPWIGDTKYVVDRVEMVQ